MSDDDSVLGCGPYQESFRSGFLAENRRFMVDGQYELEAAIIYENFVSPLSNAATNIRFMEIDAMFVTTRDIRMGELFPPGGPISEPSALFKAGTHVHFSINSSDDNNRLKKDTLECLHNAVVKHKGLVLKNNLSYKREADDQFALIFVHDDVNATAVHQHFLKLRKENNVLGTTFYASQQWAAQWTARIEVKELRTKVREWMIKITRHVIATGEAGKLPGLIGMTVEEVEAEVGFSILPHVPRASFNDSESISVTW